MADPLSITGLVFQLGEVLKELYSYGKRVREAKSRMLSLCSELAAFKSILIDFEPIYNRGIIDQSTYNVEDMIVEANTLVDDLVKRLALKQTPAKRAMQFLKFPLDETTVNEVLSKLERWKSTLLLALMTDEHSASRSIHSDLRALKETVEGDIASRKEHQNEVKREKMINSIAPVSPNNRHRQACERWKSNSPSSWFVEGPVATWIRNIQPDMRMMILVGKSGAGKTTLMSKAIESVKSRMDTKSIRLGYFYCTYDDTASQELQNILGSWAIQTCSDVETLCNRIGEIENLDSEIVVGMFEEVLLDVKGTMLLFLDAVNESRETERILECISKLTTNGVDIKCLLSTTSLPHDLAFPYQRINMSKELVATDIESYIRDICSTRPVLQAIPEAEILAAIVPQADGMFRWVDCQMVVLCEQPTQRLLRKALQNLPGNLNESYAAILSRVPPSDQMFVKEALTWLSYCDRPLTLDELCEAVVVEEGEPTIDDSFRLDSNQRLLEMCRELVFWDPKTNRVSLAHSSVRTFLAGDEIRAMQCASYALDELTSVRAIMRKCLTYISMEHFDLSYRSPPVVRMLEGRFPLLNYASTRFAVHASKCQWDLTEQELEMIDSFMQTQKKQGQSSNFQFWINCLIRKHQRSVRTAEPLYYAASFRFERYVERLFEKGLIGKDSSQPWYLEHKCGRNFSTALQVACVRGTPRTVEILLREGAHPGSTDQTGFSCYYWANNRRNEDIKRLLRNHHNAVPGPQSSD